MADASLARRYAQALVDLAQESNAVDPIGQELVSFKDVLDLSGGALRIALSNPGLTIDERRVVLGTVLGRLTLHPYVRNFLRLLADKSRFFVYDQIVSSYLDLADSLAGRQRATVTTARSLGVLTRLQVEQTLSKATGRRLVVTYQVDPGLIGGMVAQLGDKVIDASVRARLNALQNELLRGGRAAEA